MSLLVLCDPKYRNNVWCDTKIRGICDEAARRRIVPKIFTDIKKFEHEAATLDFGSSVVVLFDSINYIQRTAEVLAKYKVHPIFSANELTLPLACEYSIVSGDTDRAMRMMVDYLHTCGKQRIALVAVNKNSWNDSCRTEMLSRYVPQDCYEVFELGGDIEECFSRFAAVQNDFDAAVCTNDHIAIQLTEYLKSFPRHGEKLFIVSHTDTLMSRLYEDGITSMTVNFYNCGKACVETHFNRAKYNWTTARVFLDVELMVRGSTDNIPYTPSDTQPLRVDIAPPTVPVPVRMLTNQIGKLERVLASSDLADLKIILCLISGYSYEKMAEFCFFSADTAKYRVRKIKQALGCEKKTAAADLIRKYIKKESLVSLIGDIEEKNNKIIF